VKKFANDEDAWIRVFQKAWQIATGNGFTLKKLRSS